MLLMTWLRTASARAARPLKEALAWLLELHKPVPERTEAEIAAEVERNYRWNFVFNLGDGVFFWPGMAFISSTTILPLFVSKLTPSPLAIGLLAMIAQGSWFLPQLFTANAVERAPRKKVFPVNLGLILERLPLWFLVVAAILAARSPRLALVIFFAAYTWHGFGAGIVATGWQDMIARMFPIDRRGRFWGITMFIGAFGGALGAILSTWLLEAYPFSTNFTYCFTLAAICMMASWIFLAQVREPVQPGRATHQGNREYLATLPKLLRRDHHFSRFLTARLLMTLGSMGAGFLTVAAVQRWAVPDSAAGVYTFVYLAGQTAGNLAFGFLSDRFGHKLSLELGAAAAFLAFGVAWLAPDPAWFYLVFVLLGISTASVLISGLLVVMEYCTPERRPTYVGVANTGVGAVGVVAPLLGAALASLGYNWLFAVGAAISLATFVLFRWWVHEPRASAGQQP